MEKHQAICISASDPWDLVTLIGDQDVHGTIRRWTIDSTDHFLNVAIVEIAEPSPLSGFWACSARESGADLRAILTGEAVDCGCIKVSAEIANDESAILDVKQASNRQEQESNQQMIAVLSVI